MKHGGDLAEAIARHGGTRAEWLDLSTGINPRPWSMPKFDQALWHRLPSRADEAALLDAARIAYRVPDAVDVVAAPGTQALIQWLPHLAAPGAVAVVGPTYSEHAQAWHSAGREVMPIGEIGELPDQARHFVIVNPNNPDGRIADHAALARAAEHLAARGGWLVIDEAFADVDPAISAVDLCASLPVLILRSFGKFFGLAGVRLGFALAAPAITSRISAALGPWGCSGPALAIGTAALRDHAWADHTRQQLRSEASALEAVLLRAGLQAAGGTSLYRLVRHPHARDLHEQLARQRIWCRRFECADDLLRFGLPSDDADRDRLAAALVVACDRIGGSVGAV
jgi:cobalamin biosynthetic protein CobC